MNILKRVNSFWKKKGKKMIYIAKRTSSDKKLSIIKNNLLIDCERPHMPLEIYLSQKKFIPYAICSHGSATNFTLKKLYGIKSYIFVPKKYKIKLFGNSEEIYLLKKYSKIIYM